MRARLTLLLVVAAAGCNNPTYLLERRPLETQAPGMGMNGYQPDTDLFVLPVRRPTNAERKALQTEQMNLGLTMPVPWAGTRDFDIEIEWTVKNLDAMPVTAVISLNGGNEFGDYVPGMYVDPTLPPEEQTPPPQLLGGTPMDLAANEVRDGVFREDDMHEASVDLEAITRYPATDAGTLGTPFEVIEHNSTISSVGLENVPMSDVTPAFVRYAFTLSANGHVAFDYTVRVRDHALKLASPTAQNLYISTDAVLTPPAAPPMTGAPPAGG